MISSETSQVLQICWDQLITSAFSGIIVWTIVSNFKHPTYIKTSVTNFPWYVAYLDVLVFFKSSRFFPRNFEGVWGNCQQKLKLAMMTE